MVDRTPTAARKLASRARRRVPERDLARQREVVDAFFAAAHDGDFDRLVAVLDPEVVLRSDRGKQRPGSSVVIRGARAIAARALTFARLSAYRKPALVNGGRGRSRRLRRSAVSRERVCFAQKTDGRDENGNHSAAALHLVPRGRPQASIVLSA